VEKIIAKQALTQNGWERDVEIGIKDGRIAYISSAQSGAKATIDLALPAPSNLQGHVRPD